MVFTTSRHALGLALSAKGSVYVTVLFCFCTPDNSAQSFMTEVCNRPAFEEGLRNVCSEHPLFRTLAANEVNINIFLK